MQYRSNTALNRKWFSVAAVIAALVSFTVVSQLTGRASKVDDPPSTAAIDEIMNQATKQLRPKLPQKIDDVTTLIDVWHAGKQLTYLYEVDTHGRQIPSNFTAIARKEVVPKVCSSRMREDMVRYGIIYVYRYNLPNGSPVGEVTVATSDCT